MHTKRVVIYAVVIVVICSSSLAQDKNEKDLGEITHQSTIVTEQARPPFAITTSKSTYAYPYSCSRPESAEQDNLCIERRAAKAANIQADWAKATFWLGFFSTIAILATLAYTRITATQAQRSADAAIKAAKTAQTALESLERPYLYVSNVIDIQPNDLLKYDEKYIPFDVSNYGRTPATVRNVLMRAETGVVPHDPVRVSASHSLLTAPIFGAGEVRKGIFHVIPDVVKIEQGWAEDGPFALPTTSKREKFYFWIKISYDGPFSIGHEVSACWVYSSFYGHLVQHGDKKFNYQKTAYSDHKL